MYGVTLTPDSLFLFARSVADGAFPQGNFNLVR
jgi:hypothetical protein